MTWITWSIIAQLITNSVRKMPLNHLIISSISFLRNLHCGAKSRPMLKEAAKNCLWVSKNIRSLEEKWIWTFSKTEILINTQAIIIVIKHPNTIPFLIKFTNDDLFMGPQTMGAFLPHYGGKHWACRGKSPPPRGHNVKKCTDMGNLYIRLF